VPFAARDLRNGLVDVHLGAREQPAILVEVEQLGSAPQQDEHFPLPRMITRPDVSSGVQHDYKALDLIIGPVVQKQMRSFRSLSRALRAGVHPV
jgi:hypothetical protein